MQLCSEEKQLFSPHLIKDEEAKMVKAWELGGRDAVSLGTGQRPLSLFVQMTSSFYYPIYQIPCCPQRWSSFFTDPTLSQ